MAMKHKKNGFALIIAVIFMTVMLTLGLAMSSLGYKQELLASTATESQYAFYAADAALECVLFVDQKSFSSYSIDQPFFIKPSLSLSTPCGGLSISTSTPDYGQTMVSTINNINITTENAGTRCAKVTVYKPTSGVGTTYIFSQGYDAPCGSLGSGARFVSRGIYSHY
jgi:hypothetical protein